MYVSFARFLSSIALSSSSNLLKIITNSLATLLDHSFVNARNHFAHCLCSFRFRSNQTASVLQFFNHYRHLNSFYVFVACQSLRSKMTSIFCCSSGLPLRFLLFQVFLKGQQALNLYFLQWLYSSSCLLKTMTMSYYCLNQSLSPSLSPNRMNQMRKTRKSFNWPALATARISSRGASVLERQKGNFEGHLSKRLVRST